jgi:putative SOS response-associated peptidase YedK
MDDAVESVTLPAWISENSDVYRSVAFKLLTVASGPDLAPYCTRQPLLIDAELAADWLNPRVSTKRLQNAPAEGWVKILEVPRASRRRSSGSFLTISDRGMTSQLNRLDEGRS